jgi:hypothetical protein
MSDRETPEESRPPTLGFHAVVTAMERPLIAASARLLSECLEDATGSDRLVELTTWDALRSDLLDSSAPFRGGEGVERELVPGDFVDYRGPLKRGSRRIVVLSLLVDVVQQTLRDEQDHSRFLLPDWRRDWTASQQEWVAARFRAEGLIDVDRAGGHWRSIIGEIRANSDATSVFLCNVFRHVSGAVPHRYFGETEQTGERIRKFNLMAAEVSHDTGACVIDLDRDLAHVGAGTLHTDYRLAGDLAATAGAHALVATVLWGGLDDIFSPEVQARARAAFEARRASLSWSPADSADEDVPRYVPEMVRRRSGNKQQSFLPSVSVPVDWDFRRLLGAVCFERLRLRQALKIAVRIAVKGAWYRIRILNRFASFSRG